MPRRKNPGGDVNGGDADSTQNMSRDRGPVQSRDTTLRELQSMFSGSVDPEVVQLVLSESNYNANDAIEKLFVLSGADQDQKEDNCSSERKTDHKIRRLSNTLGTHSEMQAPTTVSPPVYSETNQAETDSALFPDAASPTILSSGLPDFPDNISQQYKALKSQAKLDTSFEMLPCNGPPGHSSNLRPSLSQQVVSSKRAGLEKNADESKHKGCLESSLEKIMPQKSLPKQKSSSYSSSEQQRLDWDLSKKKMDSGSSGISGAHADTLQDKRQKPCKERTSKSSMSSTNTQGAMISSNSLNIHTNLPSYTNKPHFQSTINSTQQLLDHGTLSSLPVTTESMFWPPAIQRQVQPFAPLSQSDQVIQGNASQSRFSLMPVTSSSWQHELQKGQLPLKYPPGNHPYQPPFFLGRGDQLSAAIGPSRQASAVLIPTVHRKLLILIRGLPGSGKSTLAQKLKGANGVVLSTDDFFYRNQKYEFDPGLLSEAHEWNQNRAKNALEKLLSPVIIDNTNTQTWEMKPYVSMAVKHGYYVKFMEPDTSWKWNVKELARRNRHGVSIEAITRMKERFETGLTVEKIMNCERKPDPSKTEIDSKTIKETGVKKQTRSPRAPPALQGEASWDLGNKFDYTTLRENTALTEPVQSLKGVHRGYCLKGENNDFLVLSESSENSVKRLSSSANSLETEGAFVSEVDISSFENPKGESSKEDTNASNSPKPQRVSRVREKRSPNVELRNNTDNFAKADISTRENADDCSLREESQAVNGPMPQRAPRVREKRWPSDRERVFEAGLNMKAPEHIISPGRHCSHDELEFKSIANAESDAKKVSAVSVERDLKLWKGSSLSSDSCTFSPPFLERYNRGPSPEFAQAPESSKSSLPRVNSSSPSVSSEHYSAFILNASSMNSDESNRVTTQHLGKEQSVELTGEASGKEEMTCDLASTDKSGSLLLSPCVDDDATECGNIGLKQHEPAENKSVSAPPPLSSILASASRSKQKMRSTSSSTRKQSDANEKNRSVQTDGKQLVGSRVEEHVELAADNCGDSKNQSIKNVSGDVHNLDHESKQAASGDSVNDIPAGVEFLKTCFPDLDGDVISELLAATSGDVMKVVDELLADESELASFPVGAADVIEEHSQKSDILASEHSSFKSSNEDFKSVKPVDVSLASSVSREVDDIPREMPAQMAQINQPRSVESKPFAQAQFSRRNTFQLTLEPAIALHLVELFGPFAGVNFQEDLNHEDLIIEVDSTLAKQLYKRWEKSIQKRKGISVDKRGNSPRANKKPSDITSRVFSGIQSSSDGHKSPQQFLTEPPQAGNLQEIMDEQLAIELSRSANVADASGQDIATNLKRKKLFEMFPGVDPAALDDVFQANQYELAPSVEVIKASCNLPGHEIPSKVTALGLGNHKEKKKEEPEEDWSWLYSDDSSRSETNEGMFQTLEAPSYQDYRAEAFQHHKLRDECFKKAALAFSKKQGELARFYAQKGHMHTEKMKEANARAAVLILDQTNKYSDENTIDLHGLHVTEAVEAMENMLRERTEKGCKAIFVITGRGNNSRGGKARIKPAILEYLKKNEYNYTEPHSGLVKVSL